MEGIEILRKIINAIILLVIVVLLYYGYTILINPPEDIYQRANLSIRMNYISAILGILLLIKSSLRK